MPTLTTFWAAGPALEAAVVGGWAVGLAAGLVQVGAAVIVREGIDGQLWSSSFILLAAATVTGFVSALAVRAEADVAAAAAERAALAERERLARSIHDGVLQVIGLSHRLGRDACGELGRVGRLAADQEAAVRALISSRPVADSAVGGELGTALRELRSDRVSVATPTTDVRVGAATCRELVDATRAALQNVELHAGDDARAWVLLEDLGDAVSITVRDDGVGIQVGRLERAAADGRLGVSASIAGRARELGGSATVTSTPGSGTVVTIEVPTRGREDG
jgi:signal transduction histidine kinase